MVEKNKSVYGLVEAVVKEKFANKIVVLHRPYFAAINKPKVFVQEFGDHINIYYLPVASKVLQYFGHLIVSLRIWNRVHLPGNQFKEIYQHVTAYCAATVTELHLTSLYKNTFVELRKPFINVQKLTLDGEKEMLEQSAMSLSELFPGVRHLYIHSSITIWMFLSNQKLPHLEHLYTENENDYNTPPIKEMIKNNLQIRSLALNSVRPDLLQFVAVELSQLERLRLENYGMNSDVRNVSIHFESVKIFAMKGRPHIWPSHFTFGDHLEEFEMDVLDGDRTKLVDFLVKYKTSLKKLRVNLSLDNFDVLQLAGTALNDMSFTCKKECDIERFISLIENCEHLKKFELFVEQTNFRGAAFDAMKNRFDQEWNVTKSDHCVHLDRN